MKVKIIPVKGIDILHAYLTPGETICGARMITEMKKKQCAAIAIFMEGVHVSTIHRKVFEDKFDLN